MQPTSVASTATQPRPNRILVLLAAAWMVVSLAIGGAVTSELRADGGTVITQAPTTEIATTQSQP